MRCPTCGETMKKADQKYHFTGAGLDNVYLSGVPVYACVCGESVAKIPMMKALLEAIGEAIVNKPGPLTGKEVRFLRKNTGLKAETFAKYLGVDTATFSRWENGKKPIGTTSDRLLRLCYATIMEYQDFQRILEEFLSLREVAKENRIDVTRSPRRGYHAVYV